MKTSELIKLLQDTDPNDECDVCIDNYPVSSLTKDPSYWDGRLQYVDRSTTPIKAGWRQEPKYKIKIRYESIQDILEDYPNLEIDMSGVTYKGLVDFRYLDRVAAWRKEVKDIDEFIKRSTIAIQQGKPLPKIKIPWRIRLSNLFKKI